MPIATPEVYAEMIDRAKANAFAYPAINITSSQTVNAAIRGFAEAESDGIIQISTGGAEFFSGQGVKEMVTGSVAMAAFAHEVAKKYSVNIALHTDHCPKNKLDGFVRPLLEISLERVKNGENPLFQSHMWDGSAVPLAENLTIAQELLAKAAAAKIILEVEIGVVGGEEDGVDNEINEKLYTTVADGMATAGRSVSARTAGTWPRSRPATCTASTSRATSSCAGDPQESGRRRGQVRQGQAVRPGPRRPARSRRRSRTPSTRRDQVNVDTTPSTRYPPRRGPCSATTRRAESTARSATRRSTTRARGAGREQHDRPGRRACKDLRSAGTHVA